MYKPLVYVDVAPFSGTYTLSGRAFEARNLLSPDYRIRYTPDGENTTFAILSRSVKLHSLQVVINRAGAASVIHTLISEDPGGSAILMETTPAADGLRMYYVGLRGGFFFLNNIDEESKPLFQGFPNSIEATICPAEEGEAERRLVGGMKHSIWYSNDRSGAGGGAPPFCGRQSGQAQPDLLERTQQSAVFSRGKQGVCRRSGNGGDRLREAGRDAAAVQSG